MTSKTNVSSMQLNTMPYRFYSHKVKDMSTLGKLFYLKDKEKQLYEVNAPNIGAFLFNIKCKIACEELLEKLK